MTSERKEGQWVSGNTSQAMSEQASSVIVEAVHVKRAHELMKDGHTPAECDEVAEGLACRDAVYRRAAEAQSSPRAGTPLLERLAPDDQTTFGEHVAAKIQNMLTDKYTNSQKIVGKIIQQELESALAAATAERTPPQDGLGLLIYAIELQARDYLAGRNKEIALATLLAHALVLREDYVADRQPASAPFPNIEIDESIPPNEIHLRDSAGTVHKIVNVAQPASAKPDAESKEPEK